MNSFVLYVDHKNSQHYVIPSMSDHSVDMSELAKAARMRLQAVSALSRGFETNIPVRLHTIAL